MRADGCASKRVDTSALAVRERGRIGSAGMRPRWLCGGKKTQHVMPKSDESLARKGVERMQNATLGKNVAV